MPSNHLLKDLPFVDEDGYFEGVCSVQMGGGISLPANVAEAAVPEDTEHFRKEADDCRRVCCVWCYLA